ncbi:12424_t:CDS:2, partial [Entrophospora sp. SA101]
LNYKELFNKTNYITLRDEADEIDSLDYDEMEVDEVAKNDNEVQNEIDHEEKDRLNFKMINMKCLRIIQSILEKIGESLRNNPSTSGFIDEVIIPNTQSKDPDLREMSIHCIGLCCILDQSLANENL